MSNISDNLSELDRVANDGLPPVAGGLNKVAGACIEERAVVDKAGLELARLASLLHQLLNPEHGIDAVAATLRDSNSRVAAAIGHVAGTIKPDTGRARDTVRLHATGIVPLTEAADTLDGVLEAEDKVLVADRAYGHIIDDQLTQLTGIRAVLHDQLTALGSVMSGVEGAHPVLEAGRQAAVDGRDDVRQAGQVIADYVAVQAGGASASQ